MTRLKTFITECKRVLKLTKKPSNEEFSTIVKISALGMLFIGAIGFILTVFRNIIG
jgi:protein transport protein SEC61 subunit gamma and related proteins